MARYSYDMSGAEPIVRDMPVKADTYVTNEFLSLGIIDGTDKGMLISGDFPTGGSQVFAGLCNEPVTTTGTIDAYNLDVLKVVINPYMVMTAEYDLSAGITPLSATTFACTSGAGHPNAGGGWYYRITDPGAGELNLIEDSTVDTTITTLVFADTQTVATTTASRFVIIAPVGQYGIACTATKIDADHVDSGYQTAGGLYGYAGTVLGNWIGHDGIAGLQELRWGDPRTHVGLTDLDSMNVAFYGEICLMRSSMFVLDSGI